MSSGNFTITKYETDALDVAPIVCQPETITTWNPANTGTVTADQVRVSGGLRKIGRKARSVTLKRFVGAVTEGVQAFKITTLPVFTVVSFNALNKGDTVSYDGNDWFVAYKTKEAGRTGR